MTSERQKKANQANARRSTGPMTPEGKRAVRLNGVRHGLLARDIVLPGEDEGDFERLRCAVHADFSPSGPVEAFLVDRVVNTLWRLRRVEKVETALLYWRVSALRIEQLAAEVRSHERSTLVAGYEMPLLGPQYEITITNGAAHAAAEQRLANARKERGSSGIGSWTCHRRRPRKRRGTEQAILQAKMWRPRPELNRGKRFCRPLRNHSATWP